MVVIFPGHARLPLVFNVFFEVIQCASKQRQYTCRFDTIAPLQTSTKPCAHDSRNLVLWVSSTLFLMPLFLIFIVVSAIFFIFFQTTTAFLFTFFHYMWILLFIYSTPSWIFCDPITIIFSFFTNFISHFATT